MKNVLKTNALLLLFVGLFSTGTAQNMQIKNDLPVFANGAQMKNAWAGGVNNPQFSPIDLNHDGILDMIIFDRTDNRILPFINGGTPNQEDFQFAPAYLDSLPDDAIGWVLTYDYNQDGRMDLFYGTQVSNVRVYRNTSTPAGLSFTLAADPIRSKYNANGNPLNLYVPVNDIPAIGDIDADGDVDLLTFDVLGSQVEWHKCLSVDSGLSMDTLPFRLQTYCYGHFYEDPNTCTAFVNQTPCGPGLRMMLTDEQREILYKSVHAGSSMLLLDLDQNGIQDLVVGDVGCNSLYDMFNNGSLTVANFDSVAGNFPNYDVPVNIPVFPAAFYMDVNNDGIKDLLSSPNQVGGSLDKNSSWYHKNLGVNDLPDFSFQKENLFQDQMIELGTGAAPTFIDYNSDGLMDLLIGNQSEYGAGSPSKLALYRNRGTQGIPEFVLENDDYLNLSADPTIENITPTVGDLDGDGDMDLLFGDDDGTIYHYENISTTGTANFVFVTDVYAGIAVNSHSAPHLADLNGDNLIDLLVGDNRGYIHYYQNNGSTSTPAFTLVTDSLGKVKINDFTGQTFSNGFSRPFLFDYDSDQQKELLVGTVSGTVEIFELAQFPTDAYPLAGQLMDYDFGSFSAPCAATIDTLGDTYIVGIQRGGVMLVGAPYPITVGLNRPVEPSVQIMTAYPNPNDGLFAVTFHMQHPSGSMELCNMLGQTLRQYAIRSTGEMQLDLRDMPNGMYLLRANTPEGSQQAKIIVRR